MPDQTLNRLDVVGGNISYALRPATCVLARELAANTAESITVPANARFALFSATADIFVNYATTATVPGDTAVSDATASELNPSMRFVSGVTTISVISPEASVVTVSFWTD
jgi:hypothetical protein